MTEWEQLDPDREKELEENVKRHLDLLNEKTVNFEDLVAELFSKGCLSVEEKFKILSGVVEEKSSNKTTQGKCGELYATLLRKNVGWGTILNCWVETGNDYLSGRFDTHFTLEGRDSSKSEKVSKFKALPHNRTEFLTHLHLVHLQIKPHSLLKCLRKSTRLQSIILENVKIPHGGREGEDVAADFDKTIPLPNLKVFHLDELLTQEKPFRSIKEANNYLDELDLKAIMFFTTSVTHVVSAKVSVSIRLRGATVLKMIPKGDEEGAKCPTGEEFVSMLRRRPDQCGGVVAIDNWSRVSLYESFVPKGNSFSTLLTHLVIYRCKITQYDPYIKNCCQLVQLHIHSEFDYEECKLAELDICALNSCRATLRNLSMAFVHMTKSTTSPPPKLTLDSVSLTCCAMEGENVPEFLELFHQQRNIVWKCGAPHPSPTFLQGALTNPVTQFIAISHFNWDADDPHFPDVKDFFKSTGTPSMTGEEGEFIFEKRESGAWNSYVPQQLEFQSATIKFSGWETFTSDLSNWFQLPLNHSTKQKCDYPNNIFCKAKNSH